jgi:hypothetical protein
LFAPFIYLFFKIEARGDKIKHDKGFEFQWTIILVRVMLNNASETFVKHTKIENKREI